VIEFSSKFPSSVVIFELLKPALIPKFRGDCAPAAKAVVRKMHNTANVFMVDTLIVITK
jgi:hypothetical protein